MSVNTPLIDEPLLGPDRAFRVVPPDADSDEVIFERQFPSLFVCPPKWVLLLTVLLVTAVTLSVTVFESQLAQFFLPGQDALFVKTVLTYASIPVVSVVFTYIHIWLALWLTYFPVNFFGILQIPTTNVGLPGWQGIIPFKAEFMARLSVRIMTSELLPLEEVMARVDPDAYLRAHKHMFIAESARIVDLAGHKFYPETWKNLPDTLKGPIYTLALTATQEAVKNIIKTVQDNVSLMVDLEDICVRRLTGDKALLNNVFIACGYRELAFIRNSGAVMGGIFGLVQLGLYTVYKESWVLPAFGFVVGCMTNWLALLMIFSPLNPVSCCCCTLQGLFLQRQADVAVDYARVVARKVVSTPALMEALLTGRGDRLPVRQSIAGMFPEDTAPPIEEDRSVNHFRRAVHDQVEVAVRQIQSRMPRLVRQLFNDAQTEADMIACIQEYTDAELPRLLNAGAAFVDECMDVEATIATRMAALPPADFEGMLHPTFQQDEWKLVLMGGVLGVLIGFIQIYAFHFTGV